MARKAPKGNRAKAPQTTTAALELVLTEETPKYYANFVSVSHTAYDFNLNFSQLPSLLTPSEQTSARATRKVSMESIAQITIPVNVIEGLIKALQTQMQKYTERFGPIKGGPGQ